MKAALLILLSIFTISTYAEDAMPKSTQSRKAFKREVKITVGAHYLLHLPEGYAADASKKWPLMLFLHGAGERGTNLTAVAVHGPPKIVKSRPDFPFIVVSPQCPNNRTWDNATLLALLDEIEEHYRVDKTRVYLTGLSMGGYGSWSLGLANPDRFAAVAPICGGGDPIGVLLPDAKKAELLKSLPVWAFHGAKDSVVNITESERMVAALKRIGNEAKFTVYPEANHDSWTQTYANEELYTWLLSHRLVDGKRLTQ